MQRLLEHGRRTRTRRAALTVLSVTAVAVAAVILPSVIRGLGTGLSRAVAGHTLPGRPVRGLSPYPPPLRPSGPTAAVLAGFRWSALAASPLRARYQPTVVWAGQELLELGGTHKGSATNDGAAFDPATGRWHRIAPVVGMVGLSYAVTAWTGHQLFVTNGVTAPCPPGEPINNCLPHAGLFDLAANTWKATLLPGPMAGESPMAAVWTGHVVVLASVNTNVGRLGVASYDPATNRWQMITPRLPARHPARYVALVATPGQLLLWSLWDRVHTFKNSLSDRAGIDVMALGADGAWRNVTGSWPQNQNVTAPVYIRAGILVSPSQIWCGTRCSAPYSSLPGYVANLVTLHRSTIPPGPLGETDPAFIWTGRTIIAADLYAEIGNPGSRTEIRPDAMALYDPSTSTWSKLPAPAGYPPLAAPPVWTGTQLLELTSTGALLSFNP
jgi:hypothetical protein